MARPAGAESSRLENGRERGSRGLADYRPKPVACQTRARPKPSLSDGAWAPSLTGEIDRAVGALDVEPARREFDVGRRGLDSRAAMRLPVATI